MASDGISVVVTVRNDQAALLELLGALAEQDRPPDEIVIVDGGSDDETVEMLSGRDSLRVISCPGANISAGRNEGVRAASYERIAVTDAGCRPVRGWISALADALDKVSFAAGVYRVDARTPFERCLAVTLYPVPEEIDSREGHVRLLHRLSGRKFDVRLATGRSMAFRRSAWAAVGGFPEDLYTGEDTWFSTAVVGSGVTAELVSTAEVAWRPRGTWAANANMFRTYARGDVRRGNRRRHFARAAVWFLSPIAVVFGQRLGRAGVVAGAVLYLALPVLRACRWGLPVQDWWRLPLLVAMKDLSQLIGAAQGLGDAARGRAQPHPTSSNSSTRQPSV